MRDGKNYYEPSGETEEIIFDEADFKKLLGEGEDIVCEDIDGDEVFIIEDEPVNDPVYEDDFEDDYEEDYYEEEPVRRPDPLRSSYAKRPLGEPYKAERKAPVTEYFEAPDETVVYSKKKIEESLDDDYEEEDDDDVSVANIFSGAFADKLIYLTGALIIVCAVIVGIVLLTGKTRRSLTGPDMGDIGLSLADVNMIGEEGIRSVFGAQADKLSALYEAAESFDYVEVDEETGLVNVSLALTTIQKDLKIKFVNRNNKLIANVPFKAEVTDSKGNTTTYTDDDKDGIIYLTDIAGGEYKVKMVALDTFSTLYAFSDEKQTVTVKDKIEYAKVDVSNEIKKESQVNIAKEDKKTEEVVVEGKLYDTVEYVMSQKAALTDESGYTAIDDRTKIKDPKTTYTSEKTALMGRFRRLSGTGDTTQTEPSTDPAPTVSVSSATSPIESGKDGSISLAATGDTIASTTWTLVSGPIASLTGDANGATFTAGSVTTDTNAEIKGNITFTGGGTAEVSVTITVKPATPVVTVTATLAAGDVNSEGTGTASVSVANTTATISSVAWTSSSDAITIEGTGASATLKAKKVTADTPVTITATITLSTGDKLSAISKDIKVIAADQSAFSVEGAASTMAVGTTQQLTFTAKGKDGAVLADADRTIACTSKTPSIATIDNSGLITAVAPGTAEFTVKCSSAKMGKDFEANFSVTVADSKLVVKLNYSSLTVFRDSQDSFGLTATVTGELKSKDVTWKSGDESIVKVSDSGALTPVKDGSVEIICASKEDPTKTAKCTVTVVIDPSKDTVKKLTDVDGNPVYKYDAASKKYVEAVFADYYNGTKLFTATKVEYKYMGWWTVGGKTYYYDKSGKKVTGEQVILGTKYTFGSDGALISGDGTFGIDVSKWNGTIDWNSVAKSGVSFAIIRCGIRGYTEGGLIEDSKYTTNIKNATAAGIKVGVYFFTQAVNEVEAVEEASMVLYQIKDYKISYPVFLDVEYSNPDHDGRADGLDAATRTKVIRAFCQTIANGGYTAGFYANKTWLEQKINTSELTQYKIWLAQYNDHVTYGNTRHDLWQYTSKGEISGISGNVDLDHSYLGY